MKTVTFIFAFILGSTFNLFSGEPQTKKELLGHWILATAETNGRPNSPYVMDRTFEYLDNGLFEGKIFVNGKEQPFPRGKYFLADDTTMICIRINDENKVEGLANTYYFHVKSDSLHLYGSWYSNVQNRPDLLQMNYINEWWVKAGKKGK